MDSNDPRGGASPEQDNATPGETRSTPGTVFGPQSDVWEEGRRAERRRAAMWGLATGGVMALIVALCVLLAYLAGG